jgi:CRISPR-associated protein Cmr6
MNARLPVPFADARLTSANKGLLLDKFMPVKRDNESYFEPLQAIAQVESAFPAYRLAYDRWAAAAQGMPDAVRLKGTVRGRLASGLGAESVTEIGCRLHHTYGVPFIPASGLKGALATAMLSADASAAPWVERAAFLFGNEGCRAYATVLDGWWVPEAGRSGLAVDVIAPHHQKYHTGDAPPTDFDSPVPNHFLTITGEFAFVLLAPNPSWKSFLEKLLRQVLEERGLGAKRSSGYGRLERLTPW